MKLNIALYFMLLGIMFRFAAPEIPLCYAEKVYYKNGKVISGRIRLSNKGGIKLEKDLAEGSASVIISMRDIDRIENDDGSISRYDYRSLYKKADNYIKQKRYEKAIGVYNLLAKAFPSNTKIRYLRGLLNHKIGRIEAALKDYEFLIDNNAADSYIYSNMGVIYTAKGRHKKALGFFEKAVKKDPDNADAYGNLAELLLRTGNYDRAIEMYNALLRMEPKDLRAIYNLGVAYMKKENYAEAAAQWKKALLIKPEDEDIKSALKSIERENAEETKKI